MTIPIDIIAAVLPVLLSSLIGLQVWLFKKIQKVEKDVLTVMIMLRDRGFQIPDRSDTDRFLKRRRRDRF